MVVKIVPNSGCFTISKRFCAAYMQLNLSGQSNKGGSFRLRPFRAYNGGGGQ
jgi:hypothetical protein